MSTATQYECALALLEKPETYPGLAQRKHSLVLLRVFQYPSFQPCSSWAVVQVAKNLFLRRVTWDQRHPFTPEPVTYGAEVPLESSIFNALTTELRAIQLTPFVVVSTIGIDGTSYGVEVGGFGSSARLSWWETPPPNWAPLQQWHAHAVTQFEALLPASTPSVYRA
jgi:hypothetical protein